MLVGQVIFWLTGQPGPSGKFHDNEDVHLCSYLHFDTFFAFSICICRQCLCLWTHMEAAARAGSLHCKQPFGYYATTTYKALQKTTTTTTTTTANATAIAAKTECNTLKARIYVAKYSKIQIAINREGASDITKHKVVLKNYDNIPSTHTKNPSLALIRLITSI